MKVRIKKVPQARTGYQVHGALANDVPAMGGADYDSYIGIPDIKMNRTLKKVPREEANLEAEGNETVMMNTGNIPAFYTIKGPRHAQGGVPLNLPDDSFIYSDFREMKIKDPALLAKFGKAVKGKTAYTPAQLSKQYDIQKYREILQDPNSDAIDRKTAEIMIRNYNMKLGALALAQEAKKGFPQGVPAVAKPFMEANGLSEADFVPPQEEEEEATEAGLEAEGEEMMAEENEAPQTMPDGSPVAMPQGEPMPEQGAPDQAMMQPPMQYGGYPMAAYGMEMGGYGMPFYSDPNQMAYGGALKKYGPGDEVKTTGRKYTKDELKTRIPKEGVKTVKTAPSGYEDLGGGYYGTGDVSGGKAIKSSTTGKGNTANFNLSAYVSGVCGRMKNGDLKGYTVDEVINGVPDETGKINKFFDAGYKGIEDIRKQLQACQNIEEKVDIVKIEGTPVNEQECICEYEDGTKSEPMPKNADGTCPPCPSKEVEEEVEDEYYQEPVMEDGYAPWWLQDTVNTMGAFGDMASINKYMPWAAQVDLEEPRPTFLDPTRELAAQSEQANIASQAAASFAGPQALNARLSQIQGQGARGAADTLSKINNQNVNIANQFEANQVGVRNQENMLNQQMANRVYDKNVVANQQFDNAKTAGRANMRQAYNTALTNRAKTDAMNQLYPNYQVDPSTGGMVNYTPTVKKADPGAKEMDEFEYMNKLRKSGFSDKAAVDAMKRKFGRLGGQMFEHGGFVYSVFPVVSL